MADVKISELTAQASANVDVSADVLALVDTSATQTKKISVENLVAPLTLDKTNSMVGIGASPESKLAIKGSSGDADLFSISDVAVPTSGAEYGTAMIKTNAAEYALNITSYNASGKGLRVYNNGGENAFLVTQAGGDRFVVDGSGNVGIGSSTIQTVGGGKTLSITGDAPEITLVDNATNTPYAWIATNDYGSLILAADRENEAGSSYVRMDVDGSEKMRINSSGGVTVTAASGDDTSIKFVSDRNTSGQLIHSTSYSAGDAGGAETEYARIRVNARKTNAANEAGDLSFQVAVNNTMTEFLKLRGASGAGGGNEILFNEDGNDVDFRFETTGNSHGFFIDGGNNVVSMNRPIRDNTANSPDEVLTLKTFYPDASSDGNAGAGPLLSFYIPDDETNPALGGGVACVRESGDDSNMSSSLTFYTSGDDTSITEKVRINSSGFMGVGIDPSKLFHINGNNATMRITDTTGQNWSWDIGVGETADARFAIKDASGNTEVFYINGNSNDAYFKSSQNSVRAMEIAQNWNGSGDASTCLDLSIGNTNKASYLLRGYNGGSQIFLVTGNNGAVSTTAGTYGTISSDSRLKENIKDANNKLNDLLSLNVKNFNYIGSEEKYIGFIAQEFEEVFPSLVTTKDTREYDENDNVVSGYEDTKGLKVGMEFAILVKAIQELSAKVEALENA